MQLEVKWNTECDKSYPPSLHSQYFRYQIMFPFYLILSPLADWTWLLEGLCFKCLLS